MQKEHKNANGSSDSNVIPLRANDRDRSKPNDTTDHGSEARAGKTGKGRGAARGRGCAIPSSERKGASLAPSHNSIPPSQRSEAQGTSRGAPAHKPEGRGAGDGSPLRGARTGAQRDGRGAGSVGLESPRSVTPGRFDGDDAGSSGSSGSSGPFSPFVLRTALDWATVLCLLPVSRARWEEFSEWADRRAVAELATDSGVFGLEFARQGRDALIARSVAGVRVLIRNPSRCRGVGLPCGRLLRSDLTGLSRCVRFLAESCAEPGAECRGVPGDSFETAVAFTSYPSVGLCVVPTVARRGASSGVQARREVYGVELQVQGMLFSSVQRGGDLLVGSVWREVAGWLYGDLFPAGAFDAVDPFTRWGRLDVATDTAFPGDAGAEWVSSGIYAGGHHTRACERWSTRARRCCSEETVIEGAASEGWLPVSGRRSLLGKEIAGRTLYLGSSAYVLLCVYERSKKRDGDWKVLGPTLESVGWDGVSEVVRAEVRVSRRWLGDQVLRDAHGAPKFWTCAGCNAHGGACELACAHRGDDGRSLARVARSCADLTFSELLAHLNGLVAEMPLRFRHTDPSQEHGPRVRDRESSAWWSGVIASMSAWEGGGGDVARVVSTRRLAAADRTLSAILTGLERLTALRGVQLGGALSEVIAAWKSPARSRGREDRVERLRRRYGVGVPEARALDRVG